MVERNLLHSSAVGMIHSQSKNNRKLFSGMIQFVVTKQETDESLLSYK